MHPLPAVKTSGKMFHQVFHQESEKSSSVGEICFCNEALIYPQLPVDARKIQVFSVPFGDVL
jgi:hypothetical protein